MLSLKERELERLKRERERKESGLGGETWSDILHQSNQAIHDVFMCFHQPYQVIHDNDIKLLVCLSESFVYFPLSRLGHFHLSLQISYSYNSVGCMLHAISIYAIL